MYRMRLMEGQNGKLESVPIPRRTALKWLVAGTYVSGEIAGVTADYFIQPRTSLIYNGTKVASYFLRVFGFAALASSVVDLHSETKTHQSAVEEKLANFNKILGNQAKENRDLKKLLTRRVMFIEGLIDGHFHNTRGTAVFPKDLIEQSTELSPEKTSGI